jgi:hypothetical protein
MRANVKSRPISARSRRPTTILESMAADAPRSRPVTDIGGKEFDEAPPGSGAARGDLRRDDGAGFGQEDDRELVGSVLHLVSYRRSLMNDKAVIIH